MERRSRSWNSEGELIDLDYKHCAVLSSIKKEDNESMIRIRVFYGIFQLLVTISAQSSFGELKQVLTKETGINTEEQLLVFKGTGMSNDVLFFKVGVKNMSKIVLLENTVCMERKYKIAEEMKIAFEAIANIRHYVDTLIQKVKSMELNKNSQIEVSEKEIVALTEMLMAQLLKLDGVKAEGEAKLRRRVEVHRVLRYVDKLDKLKEKISEPCRKKSTLPLSSRSNNFKTLSKSVDSNDNSKEPCSMGSVKNVCQNLTRTEWEMFKNGTFEETRLGDSVMAKSSKTSSLSSRRKWKSFDTGLRDRNLHLPLPSLLILSLK